MGAFPWVCAPLESGRAFSERDNAGTAQVAIVNQEFARRYLQGKPAIGAHIRVQAMDMGGPKRVDREIVGVAGQVKVGRARRTGESDREASLLYGVQPLDSVAFLIAAGTLAGVALAAASVPALRAARVDPAITLREE